MKTTLAVLLPLIVFVCSPESEPLELPANLASGTGLTEMCRDTVRLVEEDAWADDVPLLPTVRISWCAGYVLGLNDAVADLSAHTGMFCVPSSATSWQLIKPIVEYAAQHPESEGMHRSALALRAWTVAFPCSREAPLAQPRLLG